MMDAKIKHDENFSLLFLLVMMLWNMTDKRYAILVTYILYQHHPHIVKNVVGVVCKHAAFVKCTYTQNWSYNSTVNLNTYS